MLIQYITTNLAGNSLNIPLNQNNSQQNPFHTNTMNYHQVFSSKSIKNDNEQAVIWFTMKASESRLVIPAKTQIGASKMAPGQPNKIPNISKESSSQGEFFIWWHKIKKTKLNVALPKTYYIFLQKLRKLDC